MMRLWRAWVAICSARENGRTQALFRIAIGAILLVDVVWLIASNDIIDPLYMPISEGGFAPRDSVYFLVELLGGHTPAVVRGLFAAFLVGAAALTMGIGGRLTPMLLLQVQLSIRSLPPDVGGSYDLVLANALFLLFLGRSDATLSVACRLRTGEWTSDELVPAFPRYLAVLQVALIYVGAGLAKRGVGWSFPYDALHYSLQRVGYNRFQLDWLGDVVLLTRIGSAVSVWWEMTFGVMVLWFAARKGWLGARLARAARFDLRIPYLLVGVVMHGSLLVLMSLGPFSPATVAFYLAFFEPEELGGRARP